MSISQNVSVWSSHKKWDLHAHFNGCIRPRTIQRLVAEHRLELPPNFDIEHDLRVTSPVSGLLEYFKPWELLKKLPIGKECLGSMVADCLEALSEDAVEYVELRNSPFNISQINSISLAESIAWLTEAVYASTRMSGVEARLILSLSRFDKELPIRGRELLQAIRDVDLKELIVGIDLSGNEDVSVGAEVARIFRQAKDESGLKVSIHAGETGRAENIIWAVNECRADRIGHGLAAAANPPVLELLREHDVCVEVCLKSNLITGGVKAVEKHPVSDFIEHSVPFVLCSDNPQIHDHTLSQEFALFEQTFGHVEVLDSMKDVARRFAFFHQ